MRLTEDAKRRQRVIKPVGCNRVNDLVTAWKRRWEGVLRWYERHGREVRVFSLKPVWRFVVGLGAAHVLETGITLHRISGLPVIPGSGLKGAARAYAMLVEKRNEEDAEVRAVFGTQKEAGSVVFLDAIPLVAPSFALDIMNSHYPKYYESKGRKPPADWESPNPVFFLTVERTPYQFALIGRKRGAVAEVEAAERWLRGALCELGIGAKTSAGYGYFETERGECA